MKKQRIFFTRSVKAILSNSLFILLSISFLNAQITVQPYVNSDAKHYYDIQVPSGYQYLYLLAKGADGGSSPDAAGIWGGEGVRISGLVQIGDGPGQIPAGSTLRLIPGQAGGTATYCGGGGGGTGIAFRGPATGANWVLLMAAGGGGGYAYNLTISHLVGKAATTHANGLDGEDSKGKLMGNGGLNGSGGRHVGSQAYPGGGAFSDGEGGCPGKAGLLNFEPMGGMGGSVSCAEEGMAPGGFGFGGGGSGMVDGTVTGSPSAAGGGHWGGGGGGGGGYSGGGGGWTGEPLTGYQTTYCGPGGGGGSYANTEYIQKLSMKSFTISPSNDGYVYYEFINPSAIHLADLPAKCLDLMWSDTNSGSLAQLHSCNNGRVGQAWIPNGSALLLASDINKCLDLKSSNTADGTTIQLWDCNGTDAQNWIFDVGTQAIRSAIDFNKCVDLKNDNIADGEIQLFSCDESHIRKWTIDGMPSTLSGTNLNIRLLRAPDKCVAATGGRTDNGTNVRLHRCNQTDGQFFTFDGRQIKMQIAPNKCVDLAKSQTNNGNNIQIYDCNGTKAQEWIYDGFTKTFRSAIAVDKCLDLDHSRIADGTNIQIWDCNGSAAQQFLIEN